MGRGSDGAERVASAARTMERRATDRVGCASREEEKPTDKSAAAATTSMVEKYAKKADAADLAISSNAPMTVF